MDAATATRFWSKVKKSSGCWEWTAARNPAGYGKLLIEKVAGRSTFMDAHRLSWQLHFGPIADGLYVCHRCDNPSCVRPEHLFLGTASDNMRDCDAKQRNSHNVPRTHCPKGHLLDEANTYVRPSKVPGQKGARVCRECGRRATKHWSDATGYEKARGERRQRDRAASSMPSSN